MQDRGTAAKTFGLPEVALGPTLNVSNKKNWGAEQLFNSLLTCTHKCMRERTTYREVDRDFPHSVSLTEDQKFLDGSTLFLDGLCQINTTKT